jgi:hypothetical protein
MKKGDILALIILMLFMISLTSSCISREKVPIIKVKAEVAVTEGKPAIEIVNVEQDSVNPLKSPRGSSDVGFPSVDAMAIVNYGKGGVSYWAAKEYQGNGTYEFVIGFGRDAMPKQGDMVKVVVRVLDRNGKALASATRLIIWE